MMASLLTGLDSNLQSYRDQILANEMLPSTASAYSRLLCSSLGQSHVISGSSSPSISSSTLISNSGDRGHLRGAFHGNSSHRDSYTSSRGYNSYGSSSHGFHGGGGTRGGYSRGGGFVPCDDRKCTHCGSLGQNMSRHYSNLSRHYSSL